MTIHLVYPHQSRVSAPDVIGWKLAEHLGDAHDVKLYDWDDVRVIRPKPGDVLIGHPHPLPGTIWRRSARRDGWARRIMLSPFNGDAKQVAFLEPLLPSADCYLAITGRYWWKTIAATPMAEWECMMEPVDLAVDPALFPQIKRKFAAPGSRRVLYLGHSGWQKNPSYLTEIALQRPDWQFDWIGSGPRPIAGWNALGRMDTSQDETRKRIAEYDFVITVGEFDANPMTVLETMSWGLIPVCTPQSGYVDEPGVVNVPLGDAAAVASILDRLQMAPEHSLLSMQNANAERIKQHYNWPRFCEQVEAAVSAKDVCARPNTSKGLRRSALTSPYAPWRRDGFRMVGGIVINNLRRMLSAIPL